MDAKVVTFPLKQSESVAEQLRTLADEIASGKHGAVHSVSWVADCGDMRIEVGFIGNSPLPGPTAHMMFSMGMQKLTKS